MLRKLGWIISLMLAAGAGAVLTLFAVDGARVPNTPAEDEARNESTESSSADLEALLASLQSSSAATRVNAALELAEMGPAAQSATPLLLISAADEDYVLTTSGQIQVGDVMVRSILDVDPQWPETARRVVVDTNAYYRQRMGAAAVIARTRDAGSLEALISAYRQNVADFPPDPSGSWAQTLNWEFAGGLHCFPGAQVANVFLEAATTTGHRDEPLGLSDFNRLFEPAQRFGDPAAAQSWWAQQDSASIAYHALDGWSCSL